MTNRVAGYLFLVLGCSAWRPDVTLATPARDEREATQQTHETIPSAGVLKTLTEAWRLADADRPLESLRVADEAAELARQNDDPSGEALAADARGDALERLEHLEEAVAAWQDASQLWARAGDAPRQIRALVRAALSCVPPRGRDAEDLLARGLSKMRREDQDPDALAQALYDAGIAIFDRTGLDDGLEQAATDYLREALAIRERQTPPSRKLVETINALAYVLSDRGMLSMDEGFLCLARDYYARALEIGQRAAPGTPAVVESLHQLGFCEYSLEVGDPEARDHYLEALRLQRALVPDGSMEEVSILRDLGVLEVNLSEFAAAHEDLEQAVALGERLGPRSAMLERSLENLGNLEDQEGDPVAARALLERALSLKKQLSGNLGSTYINLGMVALDQYDFGAARNYLERALIFSQQAFPDSLNVPFALGNLALACYREGDLISAFDYERRSLEIMEAKTGDSLDVADGYGVMGEILCDQRKFDAAAVYLHRALDIRQKQAPDSLHVSDALVDLARLERARGHPAAATADLRRALKIGRKACPNSWCAADVLNDLGQLEYEQGDLGGAERDLREAVDLREKSLGPFHPDLARSLNALALTLATVGKRSEAREKALRAEGIGAEHLRISARTLTERQALAYEGIRASGLDVALSLGTGGADDPSAGRDLFDAVIRSRALVFDELAARHRSAHTSEDPDVAELAGQLASARRRLATLVFRGAGDATPEAYRTLLDDARDGKESAERRLAERSAEFRQDQARTQVGLAEVASSLPAGSALVAFVRYSRHDFRAAARSRAPSRPIPSYAAFVLRSGRPEPEFIALGSARPIEDLLASWRRDIARQAELMDPSATAENASRRVGGALRRRIWDPLARGIGDAGEVFVVPDAALHLVNLVSLPVGDSRYLIETGPLIHHLSTERDLVPSSSRRGEGILVVGNPAFDRASNLTVALKPSSTPRGATLQPARRGTRSACGSFKTLRFPPLPASEKEANDIAALWKESTSERATGGDGGATTRAGGEGLLEVTGSDASRETFEESAPGKRVLHVATHGFFMEGNCESAGQRAVANQERGGRSPAIGENPLLLSGLAFAGANRRAAAGADESDGILTAEEIAGIDLDGVDWAVLSACDTGVGEIKVGEGVFGLRRAFQVAGARTVIMSLWQIEDEATRQWMTALYQEHFQSGKDTRESVRAATLKVLRRRRASLQSTHPFFWGAFIAAGDWH